MNVDEALPVLKPYLGEPASDNTNMSKPSLPLVSAKNLVYSYPNGPRAINGVDISFSEGEFVAILGSNGSGKTTLALNLAGALSPDRGNIFIKEEPYKRDSHQGIIGYVFQEPVNQIVTMKVSDELAFGPECLGWEENEIRESVERELARFDLPPDATPLHLSPAEARKLAIASTLSMNPKMIILDEPTNNLDEDECRNLMAHLKMLQENGATIVIITHDVEIACNYADRVVVMTKGNIVIDAPTRQAMTKTDLLSQCDVTAPPIVELSLALWPDHLPTLTVSEFCDSLTKTAKN